MYFFTCSVDMAARYTAEKVLKLLDEESVMESSARLSLNDHSVSPAYDRAGQTTLETHGWLESHVLYVISAHTTVV